MGKLWKYEIGNFIVIENCLFAMKTLVRMLNLVGQLMFCRSPYMEPYQAVILVSKDISRVLAKGIKHKGVLYYMKRYCPFSRPGRTSTK